MMNKYKNIPVVSIIVPVCNVEKTVSKCIESLIIQSYNDIEILCIDDGSKDTSLDILREFAQKDKRVKIVSKENRGYGHTINLGLELASGEYICILESDDFAEKDMVETLLTIAQKYDADVVKGNYLEYKKKSGEKKYCDYQGDIPEDSLINEIEKLIVLGPTIWAGIYRKSYLDYYAIRCNESPGASFQDTGFSFKVMINQPKIYFTKKAVLNYCIDNETSSVKDKEKVFCVCNEFEEMYNYMHYNNDKDSLIPLFVTLKYYSYKWNLDRLDDVGKFIFSLKMHYEFRTHSYLGQIERCYFSIDGWTEIHEIIFNLKKWLHSNIESYGKKNFLIEARKQCVFIEDKNRFVAKDKIWNEMSLKECLADEKCKNNLFLFSKNSLNEEAREKMRLNYLNNYAEIDEDIISCLANC